MSANPDLLTQIDDRLKAFLGDKKQLEEMLEANKLKIDETRAELLGKIEAFDGELKGKDKWIGEVEAKANSIRLGNGSLSETDALRNALPEDIRGMATWVEQAGKAAVASGSPNTLDVFKANDPCLYLAVGAWLQAHVKKVKAGISGDAEAARKWKERSDQIAEQLLSLSGVATTKAALQEDTDAEGGFLVPTIVEAVIGRIIKDHSIVEQAGPTVIEMTRKTHQLPTLANDFTVTLVSEEGTIGDSAPASPFGQGTLTAKKFAGLVTLSEELLEDSIVNLTDFVLTHLLERVGRLVDTQALEGDGVGANFTGLFSASGLNSVAGGSNALSEDELRKLIYGGEEAATLDNGVIFAHPWIMRDALGLTISSGTPWFPVVFGPGSQGNARPSNIWGVPAFLTAGILRNRGGGTNETTVYHGNPAGLVIGNRTGTTFRVDPYTKMDTAQVRARLLVRKGILVWVPGYFTKLTAVTVAA